MLTAIVIGYLKLSAICLPFVAAIAIYDTHMYPVCSGCGHNLYARRPKFFGPLAMCRRHGWIAA